MVMRTIYCYNSDELFFSRPVKESLELSAYMWKRLYPEDQIVLYSTQQIIDNLIESRFFDRLYKLPDEDELFFDSSRYRVMSLQDSPFIFCDPDFFVFDTSKQDIDCLKEKLVSGQEGIYYYFEDLEDIDKYTSGFSSTGVRKVLADLPYCYECSNKGGPLSFFGSTGKICYPVGQEVLASQRILYGKSFRDDHRVLEYFSGRFVGSVCRRFGAIYEHHEIRDRLHLGFSYRNEEHISGIALEDEELFEKLRKVFRKLIDTETGEYFSSQETFIETVVKFSNEL